MGHLSSDVSMRSKGLVQLVLDRPILDRYKLSTLSNIREDKVLSVNCTCQLFESCFQEDDLISLKKKKLIIISVFLGFLCYYLIVQLRETGNWEAETERMTRREGLLDAEFEPGPHAVTTVALCGDWSSCHTAQLSRQYLVHQKIKFSHF